MKPPNNATLHPNPLSHLKHGLTPQWRRRGTTHDDLGQAIGCRYNNAAAAAEATGELCGVEEAWGRESHVTTVQWVVTCHNRAMGGHMSQP